MKLRRIRFLSLVTATLFAAACSAPTPGQLLADAQTAIAAGEPATASIHLKNLLLESPNDPEARFLLGTVSVEIGDFPAAESELRRAAALGFDRERLQLPLLQALVGQRKFAEAIEQFEGGPSLAGPQRAAAMRVTARAQQGLGAQAEAETLYRRAVALDPTSLDGRVELGAFLVAAGSVAEGGALITRVLDEAPDYAPALLVRSQIETLSENRGAAEATLSAVISATAAGSPDNLAALASLVELQVERGAVAEATATSDRLLALAPLNPMAAYLKARTEFASGDVDGAERRLEPVVAELPALASANRLLGMINAAQRQFGQAEAYLQAAATAEPENPTNRLILAQVFLRQGKVDDARAALSGLIPQGGSEAMVYALAGRTSEQLGDAALAEEFYAQGEASQLGGGQEAFDLAGIYAAAGQLDRAARVLSAAEVTEQDAETLVTYMLALAQISGGAVEDAAASAAQLAADIADQAWPRNLQGLIELRRNDFDAALAFFAAALAVEPDNVPALVNSARTALIAGNPDRAREFLRRAVAAHPDHVPSRMALAALEIQAGNFAAVRALLADLPESVLRLRVEGALAMAENRTADAANIFRNLFAAQPNGANAMLAYAAAQRASLPEPEAVLREWSNRAPDDAQVRFLLGNIDLGRGNHAAAVSEFEAVLAAQPGNAAALNNLAWLYNETGDERALETALSAYAAEPENPAIADTVGWLYVQNGDAAAGLPYLEQAAIGLPDLVDVDYHIGIALADIGEVPRAIELLEEVVGSPGEFTDRDDAQRRLGELRAR